MTERMGRDALAVLLSVVYVGAAVGASEIARRWRGGGDELSRKIVHVMVGLWIVPTLFLYTKWYWAALLPALAIVGNAASLRYKLMPGIERAARNDYGTVLFPASFVICLALFFDSAFPAAAAVGITIMALGDAAAAIYGRAYGRRRYTFLGARKSIEGSAAMLVVSTAAALATLLVFGARPAEAAVIAVCCAAAGTALEAAGRNGFDNLTVPVACSGLAYALHAMLGG